MTPKARGWLMDGLAPVGVRRRVLSIPDNPAFIQAVNGAIYELSLSYNWQEGGSLTPEQCAEYMQAMFIDYLESKPMLPKRYISGLECDTINQSAFNIIKIRSGECRDATDENDLTLAADMYLDPPSASLTANTWYKVIFATLGGNPAPRIEAATYEPVAFERHIGWVKTQIGSTLVIRQTVVSLGNSRVVIPQDASTNNNTQRFMVSDNPPVGFTTYDLSSFVPPACVAANIGFRAGAPDVGVNLLYRQYGRTHAVGAPRVFSAQAGATIEIRLQIPIYQQRFDLYASVQPSAAWLMAWLESYIHEV